MARSRLSDYSVPIFFYATCWIVKMNESIPIHSSVRIQPPNVISKSSLRHLQLCWTSLICSFVKSSMFPICNTVGAGMLNTGLLFCSIPQRYGTVSVSQQILQILFYSKSGKPKNRSHSYHVCGYGPPTDVTVQISYPPFDSLTGSTSSLRWTRTRPYGRSS